MDENFKASPDSYCLNWRSLYSGVAGAELMQALKAAFQLSYVVLLPVNVGMDTLFSCFHKSCPMEGLVYYVIQIFSSSMLWYHSIELDNIPVK